MTTQCIAVKPPFRSELVTSAPLEMSDLLTLSLVCIAAKCRALIWLLSAELTSHQPLHSLEVSTCTGGEQELFVLSLLVVSLHLGRPPRWWSRLGGRALEKTASVDRPHPSQTCGARVVASSGARPPHQGLVLHLQLLCGNFHFCVTALLTVQPW